MPGQKSIRLAKKDRVSSLPDADSRRFQLSRLFPPRLFAEKTGGCREGLIPALFGFGACSFARATR
jgi:hypothetical protein